MSNIKKDYEELVELRKQFSQAIEELEKNEYVEQYLDLINKETALILNEKQLYIELKMDEYVGCNHVWAEIENTDGRQGCLRCGLDESIMDRPDHGILLLELTEDERIMAAILNTGMYNKGIHVNCKCNLKEGMELFKELETNNPDTDDETLSKLFCIANEMKKRR